MFHRVSGWGMNLIKDPLVHDTWGPTMGPPQVVLGSYEEGCLLRVPAFINTPGSSSTPNA